MENQAELAAKQQEMQHLFASLSKEQRNFVVNYLNSYNLTAWMYNELLDDQSREYIDQAMKFTMETKLLDDQMSHVSGDPHDVDLLVDELNVTDEAKYGK